MDILVFLAIGLSAGWISNILTEGHGASVVVDLCLGAFVALFGGLVFSSLGVATFGMGISIFTSMVGAIVFLLAIDLFSSTVNHP